MVTIHDCIQHFEALKRRAQINLVNAEKRNDTRAVDNLNRKIQIYQLTIDCLDKIPIK